MDGPREAEGSAVVVPVGSDVMEKGGEQSAEKEGGRGVDQAEEVLGEAAAAEQTSGASSGPVGSTEENVKKGVWECAEPSDGQAKATEDREIVKKKDEEDKTDSAAGDEVGKSSEVVSGSSAVAGDKGAGQARAPFTVVIEPEAGYTR